MSTEIDPIAAYRNQANLKSIIRSDPSVQAILATSVYSTIYHYEQDGGPQGEGEWVKQKAEGPLFVVRRSTIPEHAIFMLNRQTVKNVTIPLAPGEMKVSAVGAGMLQIARRGEKVRRGVWFSEGEETVQTFKAEILKICGEPSARPLQGSTPVIPSGSPAPVASPGGASMGAVERRSTPLGGGGAVDDGFSRLFAGLMPTPPSQSNGVNTTTPAQTASFTSTSSSTSASSSSNARPTSSYTQTTSTHYSSHPVPASASSQSQSQPQSYQASVPPPSSTVDHTNIASDPPTPKAPSPAPPVQPSFAHPPGQTVDDLLNSILGVSSGTSAASAPAFSPIPPPSSGKPGPGPGHGKGQGQGPDGLSRDQSNISNNVSSPPPPQHNVPTPNPIHASASRSIDRTSTPSHPTPPDALHVHAASPFPSTSSPRPHHHHHHHHHRSQSQTQIPSQSFGSQGEVPSPIPAQALPNGHGHGHVHVHPVSPFPAGPDPGILAREAVTDVVLRNLPDQRLGGKEGLARTVAGLLANEPRFVDDLWEAYLARWNGGPG